MINLSEVAAKLDADEALTLTYRFPIETADGGLTYETRKAKLLDVAEEAGLLYVSQGGKIIWVKIEEAVEITLGVE